MPPAASSIELSVVAPAHDEEENVRPLVEEIARALASLDLAWEIVLVDDNSTDGTRRAIEGLLAEEPRLRLVTFTGGAAGARGQSAAFHAGFRAARGALIASIDADLQNDPADLPAMLRRLRESGADLVQGDRSRARRDTVGRRASSRVGRAFRRWILGDGVRDTGCSLRVMRREVALALPLQFAGMHRFIPITARQLGYRVVEHETNHRRRLRGRAKYGVWGRAWPGLLDLLAVRWMRSRRRGVSFEIAEGASRAGAPPPAARTPEPHEAPT